MSTQMDEVYFTPGGFDVLMDLEDFEEDEQFSTSHDYKLSKIIANEKFQGYLLAEMAKLGTDNVVSMSEYRLFPFKHPAWTAAKIDAIELIYSLNAAGSGNNGNNDISELVAIFEFIFRSS